MFQAWNGVAAAATWPTLTAAMGGSVDAKRRTTAMSMLTVTYIAALAVGPLVGGVANDLTGSRVTSFYLVSGLFLVTALAACLLVPHRSQEEMATRPPHGQAGAGLRVSDLLAGLRAMPDMMALAFCAFFAIGLLVPIVKLFAMDELRMSETEYGGLVFPIALVVAGTSLVSGRLGDRWGKPRSVKLGLLIAATAMWTITAVREPLELAVAAMFLGIGFVFAMPAWLALVSDMAAPWTRGAVIGALGTAQGVGAILGAAAGSYLYKLVRIDLFGMGLTSHYAPFVASAVTLTACLVLAASFVHDGDTRRVGSAS